MKDKKKVIIGIILLIVYTIGVVFVTEKVYQNRQQAKMQSAISAAMQKIQERSTNVVNEEPVDDNELKEIRNNIKDMLDDWKK